MNAYIFPILIALYLLIFSMLGTAPVHTEERPLDNAHAEQLDQELEVREVNSPWPRNLVVSCEGTVVELKTCVNNSLNTMTSPGELRIELKLNDPAKASGDAGMVYPKSNKITDSFNPKMATEAPSELDLLPGVSAENKEKLAERFKNINVVR